MRYSPSDKTEIIRLVVSNRIWRLDARWKSSAFPDRLSTAGMIAISEAAPITTMPANTRAWAQSHAGRRLLRTSLQTILLERERIKRQTIANRRLQHQLYAA